MEDIKNRIREGMSSIGINAVELSRRTGIPKSSISQYLSGFTKPRANRISSIAKALNVSETWLMGYDVPKSRDKKFTHDIEIERTSYQLSGKQVRLLKAYEKALVPTQNAIDLLLGVNDEDNKKC